MEGRTRTLIVTLLVLFTTTYVQVDLLNTTNSSTLEEYEITDYEEIIQRIKETAQDVEAAD